MNKTEGKMFGCPMLTRIEKLTKGLLENYDEGSAFVIKNGRVFLKASIIKKDSFVMEYAGDIISEAEATERMKAYKFSGENFSVLFFTFQEIRMAMDASHTKSFARFLSHSRTPNIRFHKPFIVNLNSVLPKIAAYALRDIQQGEEIVVDYGIQCGNSEDGNARTNSDAQEDLSMISILGSFSGSCEFDNVKNMGCPPTVRGCRGKRKIISTGEFAYNFTNLAPEGFKKSFFAGYQNLGVPEKIVRLQDHLSKSQLSWFDTICTTNEIKKQSRKTSVPRKNNSCISLSSNVTSPDVLLSKVRPKSAVKELEGHTLLNSEPVKGTALVQVSDEPRFIKNLTCGKRSIETGYKISPQEISASICDGTDQTDGGLLGIKDGEEPGVQYSGLLPLINLMEDERLVVTNCSSVYEREKVLRSLRSINSSPLNNTTRHISCSEIKKSSRGKLHEIDVEDCTSAGRKSLILKEINVKESIVKISSLKCAVLSEVSNSFSQSRRLTR